MSAPLAIRSGFKILTHDGRPPVQGGDPVWTPGVFPFVLDPVDLDTSREECAAGWNYSGSLAHAFRIAGLWPNGRPSCAVLVEASADAIERGDKRRASSLTLVREATAGEIEAAVREMSAPFAPFVDEIVVEQLAWRHALARPAFDATRVEDMLTLALKARGLNWTLKRFATARDARAAWDAWAARDARDAWAAWDARDAWAAWAAWDARAAWDAWAAWDALTYWFAVKRSWLASGDPLAFSIGIRDAYEHGLAVALPTGPNELGWAMIPPPAKTKRVRAKRAKEATK